MSDEGAAMSEILPEPYSGVPLATDRVVIKDPDASLAEAYWVVMVLP